jgi:hypothetical protein
MKKTPFVSNVEFANDCEPNSEALSGGGANEHKYINITIKHIQFSNTSTTSSTKSTKSTTTSTNNSRSATSPNAKSCQRQKLNQRNNNNNKCGEKRQ